MLPSVAPAEARLGLPSAAPLLRLRGLRKSYGRAAVVDGLDLQIERGQCLGLIGPNGAGKTTTIRLCLGLAAADSGAVELMGLPVPAQAARARMRVGVVTQFDSLDPDFTVAENLLVYGRYFGMADAAIRARIPGLLDFAALGHKADARIQELSGGMKRRLSLARALINDPDLVFLDEPTTGLDPQARHLLWDRLKGLLAQGRSILLTTHFMDEAERLCDRLLVLDHGRRLDEDAPARLVERHVEPQVVEVYGPRVDEAPTLAAPYARRLERSGDTLFVYCADSAPLLRALQPLGSGVRLLQRSANLEDVFVKLTGRQLRD